MPLATIRRLQKALPEDAGIFTPYGATECLPVASIPGEQLDGEVERRTEAGEGTCVGYPVPPNRVKIIPVSDNVVESFADTVELPAGITGEIVVHGPTTTDAYWRRDEETTLAKITGNDGATWHRMGDAGYFDTEGRLWYCGRKSQRVITGSAGGNTTLFADQVEAVFNVHPEVARSALVGIGTPGRQAPVLCVEPLNWPNAHRRERIRVDLMQIGRNNALTTSVKQVLFHKSFPVDIRHNAKIGREALAAWAAKELA